MEIICLILGGVVIFCVVAFAMIIDNDAHSRTENTFKDFDNNTKL